MWSIFMLNNIDVVHYINDTMRHWQWLKRSNWLFWKRSLSDELFCQFASTQIKPNHSECNITTSCNNEISICVNCYNTVSSKCEKLLGNGTDHKLNFNTQIDEICKNAGQKLNELSRVTTYMDLSKRRMLVNTFFLSQFSYCPLVWM